jgi:membrane-bound lytic murein transglycosylase B
MRFHFLAAATALLPLSGMAHAACGGSFSGFVKGLKTEAAAQGIRPSVADAFFRTVRQDPTVLRADRKQGVFQIPFVDFSRRLISNDRINRGRANGQKYDAIFDRIETEYGVDRGVLLAFWAFETDYGTFQGDFNTAPMIAAVPTFSARKFSQR